MKLRSTCQDHQAGESAADVFPKDTTERRKYILNLHINHNHGALTTR